MNDSAIDRLSGPIGGALLPEIQIYDDVLSDPEGYRAKALAQPFGDVTVGAATFKGIAPVPDDSLLSWLTAKVGDVGPVTTFLRVSPAGQPEPNYIHTDQDMGAWTGILYLNPSPAEGDGTTFWRHRDTGETRSHDATMAEALLWRDQTQWEPVHTVAARFNRLLMFPAPLFHSRAIFENYGASAEDARLIQVMFGGPHVSRH